MSVLLYRHTLTRLSWMALLTLVTCLLASTATAQFVSGSRSLGAGQAVAVDAHGHAFVTGFTMTLQDGRDTGERAAFLAKFDSDGQQQWLKFIGRGTVSSASDLVVAADGHIYVIGYTNAGLETNEAIDHQAFLSKFDQQGEQIWYRQFGDEQRTGASGVVVDTNGDVLVVGGQYREIDNTRWFGAYLTKYSGEGQLLWKRQLNEDDYRFIRDLTTDSQGNIFVAGARRLDTEVSPVGTDAMIAKYDPDGLPLWLRDFNGTFDTFLSTIRAIAIDEQRGRIYAAGSQLIGRQSCSPLASLHPTDPYLSLCPTPEEQLDIGLFGMRLPPGVITSYDGRDIAVDEAGNVVVVGWATGGVGSTIGEPLGLGDAFVISFDPEGEQRWAHLLGTKESDQALGVAIDQDNAVYLTGFLGEGYNFAKWLNAGHEVFLAKYHLDGQQLWLRTFESPVAEPERRR